MPKQIKAYQCEFCRRYRKTKSWIVKHEKICFSNPDREVPEGSLAVFDTLPRELMLIDSYGVPDSDWREPIWNLDKELSEKYKWWPRDEDGSIALGYIRANGKWEKIEGYQPPNFAPGFSWKDEVIPAEVYDLQADLKFKFHNPDFEFNYPF